MGLVKTTIELPDQLFREAKATAARRGTALKQFVQEALQEKLARESGTGILRDAPKPWMLVAPSPFSPEERRLFDEAIEEAFEQIDPDEDNF
jgi:hypothetical protein